MMFKFNVCLLEGRNVAHEDIDFAARGFTISGTDLDRPERSILAPMHGFEYFTTVFDKPLNTCRNKGMVVVCIEIANLHPEQLFPRVTRLPTIGRIDIEQMTLPIGSPKAIKRGVQNVAKRLMALVQCSLCLFALGYVGLYCDIMGYGTPWVSDGGNL